MANTNFVANETRIVAGWLNDINDFYYDLFNGATTAEQARDAIGALAGTSDGPVSIGNLQLSGNTLSSTDTNGDINLDPNGSGSIQALAPLVVSAGAFTIDREGDTDAATLVMNADAGQADVIDFRKDGLTRSSISVDASNHFSVSLRDNSASFLGYLYRYLYLGDTIFSGTNAAGDGIETFLTFDQSPSRIVLAKDTVLQGSLISTGDVRINKAAGVSGQILLDSDDGQWNSVRFRNGTTSRYNLAQTSTNNFVLQFFDASGSGEGNLFEYEEYGDTTFRGSNTAGDGLDTYITFDQGDQNIVFHKDVDFQGASGVVASSLTTTSVNSDIAVLTTSITAPLGSFTSLVSGTITSTGTITASSSIDVGNLELSGNTIESIDTDGDITLSPDGAGAVVLTGDLEINKSAASSTARAILRANSGQAASLFYRDVGINRYSVGKTSANGFQISFLDSSGASEGNLFEYSEYGDTTFRGSNAAGDGIEEFMRFDQSSQEIIFSKPTNATSAGNPLVPVFTGNITPAGGGTVSPSSGIGLTASYGGGSGNVISVSFTSALSGTDYVVNVTPISALGTGVTAEVIASTIAASGFSIVLYDLAGSPVTTAAVSLTIYDLN